MSEKNKMLILNPGSTSTKVSVYEDEDNIIAVSIKHSADEISKFKSVWDQYEYRKEAILKVLRDNNLDINEFHIIACRGGNVKPIEGGIYELTPKMLEDMKSGKYGVHATNVGNLIAYDLGQELGISVITLDPPVTDEFCDYARLSGIPHLTRQSSFHALNQKATARKVAEQMGSSYEKLNFVVAHMGGGISVGAHQKGKVVDCNNALDGDGPYSPERAGSLPNAGLIKMCFSGEYSLAEMLKLMTGKGGLVAYMGTTDALAIEEKIKNGDKEAENIYMGMAYQVSKEIGAMAAALGGDVDAIAFTGSLAYSEKLLNYIKEKVSFIAPVYEIPGENEMDALASGALRYLRKEEEARKY